MDLINKLVGGQGCTADGAAAARNPLARLVDSVLDTAPVCTACLVSPLLVFVPLLPFPSPTCAYPLTLLPPSSHATTPQPSPTLPPLPHQNRCPAPPSVTRGCMPVP